MSETMAIGGLMFILVVIAGYIALQEYAAQGIFMATKQDLKDFASAVRDGGLNPNDKVVRERFHNSITGGNLDY